VRPLRVGISTCPNDTFTFHALLSGELDPGPWLGGRTLDFLLTDVEELNRHLLAGRLDVAKVSFAAALNAGQGIRVLPVGSALGFGVGPVLLAAREGLAPDRLVPSADGAPRPPRVLAPGQWTTASLLYRLLHAGQGELVQTVFSAIMPALEAGEAELGVCIHEGRFTYRERGLFLVEDLGERYETLTGAPLPLGGLVGRTELGEDLLGGLTRAIGASLDQARAYPAATLPTLRRHAEEQADAALWRHVELYVNEWTRELGAVGREALRSLSRTARAAGLLPVDAPDLVVLEDPG
jgi:1,4-dihydroxy-6-naphthoate synthase